MWPALSLYKLKLQLSKTNQKSTHPGLFLSGLKQNVHHEGVPGLSQYLFSFICLCFSLSTKPISYPQSLRYTSRFTVLICLLFLILSYLSLTHFSKPISCTPMFFRVLSTLRGIPKSLGEGGGHMVKPVLVTLRY